MKIILFLISLVLACLSLIAVVERNHGQSCKDVTAKIEHDAYWLETLNSEVLEDGSFMVMKQSPIQNQIIVFTHSTFSLEQCVTSDGMIWNIFRMDVPKKTEEKVQPQLL